MRSHRRQGEVIDLKGLLARGADFVRAAVEALVQAALEAEMTEAIGAEKGERSETRLSYRSGYYSRSLITRVGTLKLRVPQDRLGRFCRDHGVPVEGAGGAEATHDQPGAQFLEGACADARCRAII
jgi:hypothetical protein